MRRTPLGVCEERAITFVEVDPRWGITDERSAFRTSADMGDTTGAKALVTEALKSSEARGDEEMMAACRTNPALIEEETP